MALKFPSTTVPVWVPVCCVIMLASVVILTRNFAVFGISVIGLAENLPYGPFWLLGGLVGAAAVSGGRLASFRINRPAHPGTCSVCSAAVNADAIECGGCGARWGSDPNMAVFLTAFVFQAGGAVGFIDYLAQALELSSGEIDAERLTAKFAMAVSCGLLAWIATCVEFRTVPWTWKPMEEQGREELIVAREHSTTPRQDEAREAYVERMESRERTLAAELEQLGAELALGWAARTKIDDIQVRLAARADELRAAGIRTVWVFGWVAWGDCRKVSAIDLLIEAREPEKVGVLWLEGVQNLLSGYFEEKVDVWTADVLKDGVREASERYKVLVFEAGAT